MNNPGQALARRIRSHGAGWYIRHRAPDEAFGYARLEERYPGNPGWGFFADGGDPVVEPINPRFQPNSIGWNQPPGQPDLMVGGYKWGHLHLPGDSSSSPWPLAVAIRATILVGDEGDRIRHSPRVCSAGPL